MSQEEGGEETGRRKWCQTSVGEWRWQRATLDQRWRLVHAITIESAAFLLQSLVPVHCYLLRRCRRRGDASFWTDQSPCSWTVGPRVRCRAWVEFVLQVWAAWKMISKKKILSCNLKIMYCQMTLFICYYLLPSQRPSRLPQNLTEVVSQKNISFAINLTVLHHVGQ